MILPKSVRILPNSVRNSSDHNEIDWNSYEQYLAKNFNKHTAKARHAYSIKYHQVLTNGDASSIVVLSFDKRMHIMKSLATLSKFLGCYDEWKNIVNKYQLRWSDTGNGGGDIQGLQVFHKIYDSNNFSGMLLQLKNACIELDMKYSSVLVYCTLTGLRPAEACSSLQLLKEQRAEYLTKDDLLLEHFRFPSIFLRRTKNAYISVMFESLLSLAATSSHHVSYNSLRLSLRRKGINMNISNCRKIFATFLRNEGVEQEMIDLLQGRIPKSVFVRHYYRPDISKFDEIREKLTRLHDLIVN